MATVTHLVTPPESSRAYRPRAAAKTSEALQEKKSVYVNYDRGEHEVSVRVSGFRKADIARRFRVRVENDRFQKDWSVTEVAERLVALNRWEEVDGVLNSWVGRFARKNFPILISELSRRGCIDLCVNVFNWMKNQKNYCARNDIYNTMIRLHARCNRVDQARGLFFEMQKWSCKPDAETFNALINAHGRAGQWRWAMNLMDDMLRAAIAPSRTTYNNLINACGSSGNWREALEVCKKMTDNGVGPDLVTHNIVLSAYKSGRQYSKALSYFELMKGAKVRPDTTTFNIIIYCLSKLGQTSQALDVFNSMREKRAECRPDVVTFTSIMHLYSVRGEVESCRAVFEAMVAEGLRPNIVSYNALMGAYAVHGMSENALSVFQEIKRNGMFPDVVSYTCLLNSYGRSGQPGKAKEVFLMMRKERRKPNVVTYNALIDAYGSNGLLAEAVGVFRQMEQDGVKPNVVSVCTLLSACSRSGKKVNVETVLSAAEARGIKLNTAAYNSAIGSFINGAELEKAVALYQTMRRKKVKADSVTFTVLISGSCRMSKYSEAVSYLKDMEELGVPMTKEGQVTEAESIFKQMKMDGCKPDVIAYTSMLHAYNASEKWEKACELFLEMEENGVEPDTIACSALMRAFNKGGQPSNVFILMDLMREKEVPFTGAVFFEIFSACNTLQEWKRAIDLIQMMEPYLPSLSIGLTNQMLHLFGKSGKVEAMMKLFYKIIASGVEINLKTYAVLLEHLLAVGNWRKYIEVLEWMNDGGIQPSTQMYRDIISFGERSAGIEFEPLIRQKLASLRNKGVGNLSKAH
ncbi:hypothetical protein IGI04_017474 [Brassica rapa subsp. trilocularis]|uniref:Pentacotripeptide-repeat region of PRORP domain-containing protein n=1 Tax=Brassica rapa subsp. trilocularis TaxID=1813537 RepID=A0ABQ7MBA1_BRACM|nr:hypothetical protein IGI04_017474 [Brassica rapa subsp. trilocularis]